MIHDIASLSAALTAFLTLVQVVFRLYGLKTKMHRRRSVSARLVIDLGWLKYERKEASEDNEIERRD